MPTSFQARLPAGPKSNAGCEIVYFPHGGHGGGACLPLLGIPRLPTPLGQWYAHFCFLSNSALRLLLLRNGAFQLLR